MTKPTKWVCAKQRLRWPLASTQSDQSSLSAWRKLGSLATHWAHSEDWSDWVDAQADLRISWVHSHFVGLSCRGSFFSNIQQCENSIFETFIRHHVLTKLQIIASNGSVIDTCYFEYCFWIQARILDWIEYMLFPTFYNKNTEYPTFQCQDLLHVVQCLFSKQMIILKLFLNIIPFQQRLIESHGLQCGFCTPGFIMSMFCLLRNNPTPTKDEVERAVEGKGSLLLKLWYFLSSVNSFFKHTCAAIQWG